MKKVGSIQPIAIREGYLTQNGNILTKVNGEDWYISPKGELLSQPDIEDEEEWMDWYNTNLIHIRLTSPVWIHQYRPIPHEWILVTSYRVNEDFSRWKPETSSNGGDYGFWTTRYVFAKKLGRWVQLGYIDCKRTTADFQYTDSGSFTDQVRTEVAINAAFEFTSQGYDTWKKPLEEFEYFNWTNLNTLVDDGGITKKELVRALCLNGFFISNNKSRRRR